MINVNNLRLKHGNQAPSDRSLPNVLYDFNDCGRMLMSLHGYYNI